MPERPVDAFAACVPGLEPLLLAELRELGFDRAAETRGGVEFSTDWPGIYRANLRSALATCVLVRMIEFRSSRLPELRRKLGNLDWAAWFAPSTPVRVRARAKKSKLYHSGAIEQRAMEALEVAGCVPADDGVGVHLRVEHNVCQVSIDTSGEPLHRRGWRLATGKAPLREDLAAALVRASGWDARTPLVDPFCGSGTIAIEAAARAQGLAPGRLRAFDFERLVGFDADAWGEERQRVVEGAAPTIVAGDRSEGALRAARSNAERAGVAGIEWRASSFSETLEMCAEPGAVGAIVCNPPYGKRLDAPRALRDLYSGLGHAVGRAAPGWRFAAVGADARLIRRVSAALRPLFSTEHGGLRIGAWGLGSEAGRLPSGA